jgi:hypothetical protein
MKIMKFIREFKDYTNAEKNIISDRNKEIIKSKLPNISLGKRFDNRYIEPEVSVLKNDDIDNTVIGIHWDDYLSIRIYDGKLHIHKKDIFNLDKHLIVKIKKALMDIKNYADFYMDTTELSKLEK